MLVLPNSRFLHIPKTGGIWVFHAITRTGIPLQRYLNKNGSQHLNFAQCSGIAPFKFTFAFVRHPLGWWKSYWQYKMGVNWHVNTFNHNRIDQECASDNFHTFIRNVIRKFPGHCSKVFKNFVGPEESPIDFIGKYENLNNDLVAALHCANEKFSEDDINATMPTNVSNKQKFPASYTPELESAVREAETYAMRRFGYE